MPNIEPIDAMKIQSAEFQAVMELARQMTRIQMTPIIDDDYPEVRHEYESAVRSLITAFRNNGRI